MCVCVCVCVLMPQIHSGVRDVSKCHCWCVASTELPPDLEAGGLVYSVPGGHVLAGLLLALEWLRGMQNPLAADHG
jgi:hypothetical protein